jgi:mono/diheme cytochrome c family protein
MRNRKTSWRTARPTFWCNAVASLFLLILIAGCQPPGKPNAANRPVMPNQVLDFNELYAANCAGCHGRNGQLGPAPSIVPDSELLSVIRDGRAGTPMPPFSISKGGSLTEAQVQVLAEGITSHWKPQIPPHPSPPEYPSAKEEGNRERGAAVYLRACAGCHGSDGSGGQRDGITVGAINAPAFLALISNQELRRIIITGRHDLGMPTYSNSLGRPPDFEPLTSDQINDLVAMLAGWRATGNIVRADAP